MRVLLDENVSHDLIAQFAGHDVSTVQGLGRAGVKNGDLLERARDRTDVYVTMDRKLEKQDDLSVVSFGVWSSRPNRIDCLISSLSKMRYAKPLREFVRAKSNT